MPGRLADDTKVGMRSLDSSGKDMLLPLERTVMSRLDQLTVEFGEVGAFDRDATVSSGEVEDGWLLWPDPDGVLLAVMF